MYWYDFVSGPWSFHMAYEMNMIRALNREAKYLKRLVLTLGDNTYHMGWKSHDTDELRMRVEKYVRELNADYA